MVNTNIERHPQAPERDVEAHHRFHDELLSLGFTLDEDDEEHYERTFLLFHDTLEVTVHFDTSLNRLNIEDDDDAGDTYDVHETATEIRSYINTLILNYLDNYIYRLHQSGRLFTYDREN